MSGPAHTVAEPTKVMVVDTWGEDVAFFDLATLTETSRFPLSPNPHEVRHDPKRNLVYVSIPYRDGFYDSHEVAAHHLGVVDPVAEALVEVIDLAPEVGPHAMFLDAAADVLWLSVETGAGGVVGFDLEAREITTRIPVGVTDGKPHWMTMSSRSGRIYTANKESRSVSVIDTRAGVLEGLIPVPGGSEDVELSADGSRLFVTSRELKLLHVFDTATHEEIGRVAMKERPGRLTLTTDGKLVVTHFNVMLPRGGFAQGLVSVVDPDRLEVLHRISVGRAPCDLTTTADGRMAYVTLAHSGTLFELDLETIDVRRAIRVGTSPHGVLLV